MAGDTVGVGDVTGQVADIKAADLGEVETVVFSLLTLLKPHCVTQDVQHFDLAQAVLAEYVQVKGLE